MKLEIRLFGGLACRNEALPCYGQQEFFLDAPGGITVQGLHDLLHLGGGPTVTAVNGVITKKDVVLSDNDRIGIFPPVAGGSERSNSLTPGSPPC
jgi:sulfur carrier protein ThiS